MSTAVETWEQASNRLNAFKELHQGVFDQYAELVEAYQDALEAVEKEARVLGKSHGPFILKHVTRKIDAERLHEELGSAEFLRVGGKLREVREYLVDRTTFFSKADSGQIPKEVVDAVVSSTPVFLKPKAPL